MIILFRVCLFFFNILKLTFSILVFNWTRSFWFLEFINLMKFYTQAFVNILSCMQNSAGYWYSVFEINNPTISLPHLCGVSNKELTHVLKTLGLVTQQKNKNLQLEKLRFDDFFILHDLQNVSITNYRYNNKWTWFI